MDTPRNAADSNHRGLPHHVFRARLPLKKLPASSESSYDRDRGVGGILGRFFYENSIDIAVKSSKFCSNALGTSETLIHYRFTPFSPK